MLFPFMFAVAIKATRFSTMYRPRASRAGVGWNLRFVSGRAFGPTNGLQPIVSVISPTKSMTMTTNVILTILSARVMSHLLDLDL
jgi:hypothetical protein